MYVPNRKSIRERSTRPERLQYCATPRIARFWCECAPFHRLAWELTRELSTMGRRRERAARSLHANERSDPRSLLAQPLVGARAGQPQRGNRAIHAAYRCARPEARTPRRAPLSGNPLLDTYPSSRGGACLRLVRCRAPAPSARLELGGSSWASGSRLQVTALRGSVSELGYVLGLAVRLDFPAGPASRQLDRKCQ